MFCRYPHKRLGKRGWLLRIGLLTLFARGLRQFGFVKESEVALSLGMQYGQEHKPEAMLIALSTLCQLLITSAIAFKKDTVSRGAGSDVAVWPVQTFSPVRQSRKLLLQFLHLRSHGGAELAQRLEVLQLGFLLVDSCD